MDHPVHIAISAGLAITAMAIVGVYVLATISGSTGAGDILIQSAQAVESRDGVQISVRLENTGPAPVTKVIPVMSINGRHYLLEVDNLPAEKFGELTIRGMISERSWGYDTVDQMLKFGEAPLLDHVLFRGKSSTTFHPKSQNFEQIYTSLKNLSAEDFVLKFKSIPNDEKVSILAKFLSDPGPNGWELHSDHSDAIARLEGKGNVDTPEKFKDCDAGPNPFRGTPSDCPLKVVAGQSFATGKKFTITAVMETGSGEKIEKLIQMRIS